MYIIYSIITGLIFCLGYPFYFLFRRIRKKPPIHLKKRLGIGIKEVPIFVNRPIWIHAVSVGEVNAALPLVNKLQREFSRIPIVMSVTTATGEKAARDIFGEVLSVINFPFDFKFSVSKYLDRIKPRAVLIMETELWPRFCSEVARRSIPLILVNGRISDSSYSNYRRVKFFMRRIFDLFNLIMVQSEFYRGRFVKIGAPTEKIKIINSLKYDLSNFSIDETARKNLIKEIGLKSSDTLIAGGSTHTGEEEILLDVFMELAEKYPSLKLAIVPRRPPRFNEVEQLLIERGIDYIKRSAGGSDKKWRVLLVDRMGELKLIYSIAKIAFIGGSLVTHGGQNMLEAAAFSIPVLFGPFVNNFRETADLLLESGGGFIVTDAELLKDEIDVLLSDEKEYNTASLCARKVIDDNQGAPEKIIGLIKQYIMD